ncbi:hypothetical protein SAMN05444411_11219 [Lutibacter oricola]|uniref:Uncharacterized protein n=1 Tax=Lutibacter oricola TaxID=762486 RepID=A0A1H3FRI3_9FLAO|nr:hypothetical protein [Lutibacter oricola]SDX92988.1 hypothetical protein SAMN05444411_11219 [Lutibacter oricola]
MKILIVSGYFKPNITPRAFRTTELAVELARQGNDVTIYLPWVDYDYSCFEMEFGVKILFFGKSDVEKRLFSSSKIAGKFYRLMNILFQYPKIKYIPQIYKTLQNEKGYDLLISIGAPYSIHWGVDKLIRRNEFLAKKWIADCGDPFMGSKVEIFPNPFWFKFLEKSFCKRANYITVPIEKAINSYYPEFRSKIKVIPQGFNFSKNEYNKVKENPVPTFAYAGMFYKGNRDPRPFLDLLLTIDLDFLFVLYTPKWEALYPYIEKFKGKIEIRELVPRDELLSVLSQMDFLVNFENGTASQSPSKLIDYTIASRPILSVSQKPDITILNSFLTGDYSNQFIFENIDNYNIKNVSKQFIRLK